MKLGNVAKMVNKTIALFAAAAMLFGSIPVQAADVAKEEKVTDTASPDETDQKPVLAPEAADVIRQDYLQMLKEKNPEDSFVKGLEVSDMEILQYCGTYDAGEVVLMAVKGVDVTDDTAEVRIGKYKFVFSSGSYDDCFYLHKDHEFILVKDAYKDGLLSGEDVTAIAKAFGDAHEVKLPFTDVKETDWFYEAVCALYREDVIRGLDEFTFGPYESVVRAQFATILYRMDKEPKFATEKTFSDIDADMWYTDSVLWAAENGIVTGYENGLYGPVDDITREQMAVMLYRYAKYKGYDISGSADYGTFEDADAIQVFAKDGMKWAVANGIIKGKDLDGDKVAERLEPQGSASRAEAAVMIQRFVEKYLK